MEEFIKVQCRLSRLLLTCNEDVITKADDIKMIPDFKKCEDGMVECKYKVEVTNPVDYSKEEFKKKFNGNKMISQWVHTIENGVEKLVIVID